MWVNLTTNTIEVYDDTATDPLTIQPSGIVVRVNRSKIADRAPLEGVQIVTIKVSPVGVPEPADGKRFIVTEEVARACPDRTDLFVVLTDTMYGIVRIGCLIRYSTCAR